MCLRGGTSENSGSLSPNVPSEGIHTVVLSHTDRDQRSELHSYSGMSSSSWLQTTWLNTGSIKSTSTFTLPPLESKYKCFLENLFWTFQKFFLHVFLQKWAFYSTTLVTFSYLFHYAMWKYIFNLCSSILSLSGSCKSIIILLPLSCNETMSLLVCE